jgi:hypothetical protein
MAGRAAAVLSAQLVLAHAADELIPSFASTDQKHALRSWAREEGQRILDEARASVAAPLEAVAVVWTCVRVGQRMSSSHSATSIAPCSRWSAAEGSTASRAFCSEARHDTSSTTRPAQSSS